MSVHQGPGLSFGVAGTLPVLPADESGAPDGGVADGPLLLPAVVRLRLDIAYDGSPFHGWARQEGLSTVQGELERALSQVLRLPVPAELTVAGRTDTGVHALGQVAHVDVPAALLEAAGGTRELIKRLRGALPNAIRVLAVAPAVSGFDARFGALSRRYRYRIGDDISGVDPLRRGVIWDRRRILDVAAMEEAAWGLLGEHDFASYCRRREGASTVRMLTHLGCTRAEPGIVEVLVEADAFCHSMVRALVGALVIVGEHRREVAWPAAVLAGVKRDSAVQVAPPHGLVLEGVQYPRGRDDAETATMLAERVSITRNRRVLTSSSAGTYSGVGAGV